MYFKLSYFQASSTHLLLKLNRFLQLDLWFRQVCLQIRNIRPHPRMSSGLHTMCSWSLPHTRMLHCCVLVSCVFLSLWGNFYNYFVSVTSVISLLVLISEARMFFSKHLSCFYIFSQADLMSICRIKLRCTHAATDVCADHFKGLTSVSHFESTACLSIASCPSVQSCGSQIF